MSSAPSTSPLPDNVPKVGKPRPIKIPPMAERKLSNGLRVIAARRRSVPRLEARLRVPAGHAFDGGDGSRARLLPETITAGTASRDAVELARELQRLGATLDARGDSDDLVLSGGALAGSARALLELMAEVVTEPAFPKHEVAVARDRVAQEILIQRSQPQGLAAEAMAKRLFKGHRYGRGLPDPEAVKRAGPGGIARFHAERVLPRGSHLVLVGDLEPDAAIDAAQAAFASWRGKLVLRPPDPPRTLRTGPPALLVDRPGSVQTNVRLAGWGLPRSDDGFFALALANVVLGGYFSSRLSKNVRETKGYTYGIHSSMDHRRALSLWHLGTAVATDVTAPALVEILYEIHRMLATEVEPKELEDARRYLAGITSLAIQTQSGLANHLDSLTAAGLDVGYVRTFRDRLGDVSAQDLREAAGRFLAPGGLAMVMVGAADAVVPAVERFIPLEVVSGP